MSTGRHTSSKENDSLALRLGSVFSPSAPINQATLFAGRKTQLQEISDSVNQRGLHAVLFGERGVGKTSLANVLPEFLENAGIPDLAVSLVNCDSTDTFSTVWKKVLREIQISMQLPVIGFTKQNTTINETVDQMLPDNPSPEDIRYLLQRMGFRMLLVIDEYDRLQANDVSRLMADTIKALSDHSVNVTILLLGVADTIDELLSEHQSIDRCLVQVHMPRMSLKELTDILDKGLSQVDMGIDDEASTLITFLSHGLPHYTHLLGLASARAAVEAGQMRMSVSDVATAIQSAVHQAQRSIMVSYDTATSSSRKDSLFEQVLLSCALAPVDELGYFTASNVRLPMSMIMGRSYDIPAFSRHLEQFCQPERGNILQKSGIRGRNRFRFRNPLLQPYVLIRGLSQSLITLDMLEKLRGNGEDEQP